MNDYERTMLCKRMERWDNEQHRYLPHFVPVQWRTALTAEEGDEPVQCASCGERMTFGDSYVSLEIHDKYGLGYCVCEKCHAAEVWRKYSREE